MSTPLSVIDAPENEAGPEPPDEHLLAVLNDHLGKARQALATCRHLSHLEATPVEGLTKGDIFGPKVVNATKTANLWDVTFGQLKDPTERPDHGEKLEVRIAGLEATVAELEALVDEHEARIEPYATWARENGKVATSPMGPDVLQRVVGAQETTLRELEDSLARVEERLAALEPTADAEVAEADAA